MKKWKKRLDGTNASPLDRLTIFVDRNSGGRNSKSLIVEAGINIVLHDEYFPNPKTQDHEWLSVVAQKGWIVVTCDYKTKTIPLFLYNLKKFNAQVFYLSELNGRTAAEKAQCIIKNYEKMLKICNEHPAPFICRIDFEGKIYFDEWEKRMEKMYKTRRL